MARGRKAAKSKEETQDVQDSQDAKDNQDATSENKEGVGENDDQKDEDAEEQQPEVMRILFHGSCPKLTPRGVGNLEYEIGISEKSGEASIRVVKNERSGAFSTMWVPVADMWKILDQVKESPFKAVVLRELYLHRSSNNHGFLGAVLKAEGVVEAMPDQVTSLVFKDWKGLMDKVEQLKKTDVSLPDLLAAGKNKTIEVEGKGDN